MSTSKPLAWKKFEGLHVYKTGGTSDANGNPLNSCLKCGKSQEWHEQQIRKFAIEYMAKRYGGSPAPPMPSRAGVLENFITELLT